MPYVPTIWTPPGIVGEYSYGRARAVVGKLMRGAHEIESIDGDRTVRKRGTLVLKAICDRADQLGCTLIVHVCPPHERRNEAEIARLRAWYADHGFGEYPDRWKWMMRHPRRRA